MAKELTYDENQRAVAGIKTLLQKENGNQTAVAKRIGIKASAINQILSGKNGVSLKTTKAIARELGIGWPQLLTGSTIYDNIEQDETTATIAYATRWLGVEQPAVDRVMALCRGGVQLSAKQLLEQLMAAQNTIEYERLLTDAQVDHHRGEFDVGNDLDPPLGELPPRKQ